MSGNAQFSVYSLGETEADENKDLVRDKFAKLFGISEEKANKYFQSKKLIRKGLTQGQASAYQDKLQKIGMPTVIEEAIAQAPASNEPVNNEKKAAAPGSLSLLPADHDTAEPQSPTASGTGGNFTCPKCHITQDKSSQCESCGVFFDKLVDTTGTNRTTEKAGNTTRSKRREEPTQSDGNIVVTIIAAGVVAIALAFAWKIITIQTGYEFGIVAWAIGGAIGGVGILTGARGEAPAIACACLAVCAILGGKYMIEDYYLQEVDSFFSGELLEEIEAEYDEYWGDVEAYKLAKKDDYSVKRFMSDYGYTNADSVTKISDAELAEFREDMAYNIEELDNVPAFDETMSLIQNEYEAEVGSESTFTHMIQNIGLLGALFIFLGMSTAYKLVREND